MMHCLLVNCSYKRKPSKPLLSGWNNPCTTASCSLTYVYSINLFKLRHVYAEPSFLLKFTLWVETTAFIDRCGIDDVESKNKQKVSSKSPKLISFFAPMISNCACVAGTSRTSGSLAPLFLSFALDSSGARPTKC